MCCLRLLVISLAATRRALLHLQGLWQRRVVTRNSYGDLNTISPTIVSERPLMFLQYFARGTKLIVCLKFNVCIESIVGEMIVKSPYRQWWASRLVTNAVAIPLGVECHVTPCRNDSVLYCETPRMPQDHVSSCHVISYHIDRVFNCEIPCHAIDDSLQTSRRTVQFKGN